MKLYQTITIAVTAAGLAQIAAFGADRRQTYEELAVSSDKVVLGTVGVRSSHWGDDAHIYTDVLLYPDVTVKGADEGAMTVEMPGGTVGDTTMTVSDGPELPEGQQVVVFLKRESNHFVVMGRSAGSLPASSGEAAAALDSAFTLVERSARIPQTYKRGLAGSAIARATNTLTSRVQTGCYGTDGAKWGTPSASYKIGTTIPTGWASSIDAAAATWGSAGAAFKLVNDSTVVNELSYKDLVAVYGSSYANTLAVTTTWTSGSTGRITKATIEIGNKWPWSTSGEANMADVQNILTHEFGHWMRLLDIYSPTTCSEVTMWGSAGYGETKKRTLEQADIDGLMSLYGAGTGGGGSTTVTAPSLTSPANGATGISATPTLSWTAAANATSYDVYFGTSSSPALLGTVTATSVNPGTLTAGVTYFWRVVAKNSSSNASSSTFSFTVVSSSGGGTGAGLTLLSPADGATGVSLTPLMKWSAVTGATTYDIYIGTTPTPFRIGSISATAVTVSGFRSATVYYWKVVARTASGTVSSTVASFKTN